MELNELASEKIHIGEQLIDALSSFSSIEGVQKLHRKIKQELNFLKKVSKENNASLYRYYLFYCRFVEAKVLKKNTYNVQI